MDRKIRYSTFENWAKYFQDKEGILICSNTIRARVKGTGLKGETARGKGGKIIKEGFYSEIDVRRICADVLQNFPQADENGFFEKDGKRYATTASWEKYFAKNGISLTESTIFNKLKNAGKIGITGRGLNNHIYKDAFYCENDVKEVLGYLLQAANGFDEDGFLVRDAVRYASAQVWSKHLHVPEKTIKSYMKKIRAQCIKGRSGSGSVVALYSETDIDKLDHTDPQELFKADKSGFFRKDGEEFGTIESWSRVLNVSTTTITRKLQGVDKECVKGETTDGRIHEFYSKSFIFELCEDLLSLPEADENGFFEKDGVKYGIPIAWSTVFSLTGSAIRIRLAKAKKKGILARIKNGLPLIHYSEPDVKEVCTDLLNNNLPKADENGFFQLEDTKYGTANAWADALSISKTSTARRLKKVMADSIKGKAPLGQVRNFFPEPVVLETCADLLQDFPEADGNGFFEQNGIKYGTVESLSRAIRVSTPTIIDRIRKKEITGIKGRPKSGPVTNFYPEPAVLEACADLLNNN